jgi:hypothetical protein
VVEGELNASDLALLTKWIELNRDVLPEYWEGEIYQRCSGRYPTGELDAIRTWLRAFGG